MTKPERYIIPPDADLDEVAAVIRGDGPSTEDNPVRGFGAWQHRRRSRLDIEVAQANARALDDEE